MAQRQQNYKKQNRAVKPTTNSIFSKIFYYKLSFNIFEKNDMSVSDQFGF